MFRRSLLLSLVALVIGFVSAGHVMAQGAPVRGVVKLMKADNTVVPVADAVIEVFKTDSGKGTMPSSKTNKKGEFVFVQFPYGQTFALSISGAGIAPQIVPAVKAGQENIAVNVTEGDGRKFTEAEVRQAIAGAAAPSAAGSGELTAEQKKAQAEQAAKVAAVEASNKKIEQENAIITRTLQEGNAAFTAKDFDLAIAKYSEGVAASPDFAGSAPVLLNNKGAALRERAVVKYNQSIKATDASVKVEGLKAVRADLGEAAESYNRSLTLLKNAKPTDITDPKIKESQITLALTGAKDTFRLMAATEQVDETKMEVAKAILPEYLAAEADPAKKEASKLILADLYRVVGDSANAIAEYRKVLEASPDNLDAMAGLGLSLVNAGYISNDKTQLQEGSNILQKYATSAPDGHKYKNDAVALVENLKAEQKITPQKVSAPKRKN
ncbi:MAG TPA: hypothetical protein VL572_01680 [Pyrinomonadaceae bacterium]|nr:hypothetical protein [Pyrinomonadaceae bacterium]